MAEIQSCPICSADVQPSQRYPDFVCRSCSARAVDENGRQLRFTNESASGGFIAYYPDTGDRRDSHICFIDGIECFADEAHMGGTIIRINGK